MASTPSIDASMCTILAKRLKNSRLRKLHIESPGMVDFSSNDFLGLARDELFKDKFIDSLKSLESMGSTGSRLLDGNSHLAENLETKISMYHSSRTALLVNSGYEANLSIFSCIPQPGDIILYDELIHASVHDGMARSRAASKIAFKHNCAIDLKSKIQEFQKLYSKARIFVATEGVYSMEGDLAPLDKFIDILRALFPKRDNGYLIVDEAHSIGLYGRRGAGLVSHLGLEKEVFLTLVTFGKSLGCTGAAILCNEVTKQYLLNYARPIIYSTFMSTPNILAIATAYDLILSEKYEREREELQFLIAFCHQKLQNLDRDVLRPMKVSRLVLSIDPKFTQTPVFALQTAYPRQLAKLCQNKGFLLRPIVAPTVPKGKERVRLCLHAFNTTEEIEQLFTIIEGWIVNNRIPVKL